MKKLLILSIISLALPLATLAAPAIPGCTDSSAFNYDPSAMIDDGSCIPVIVGCTDPKMSNYDPEANTDSGDCRMYSVALIAPNVVSDSMVLSGGIGGVTFTFRTNKFMTCGLLVSQESQGFAINSDGVPTLNGWVALGYSGDKYGYDSLSSLEYGSWTGHQIGVALNPGNYFIRPLCDYFGKPVLGNEYSVTIR